ncbi:phytanoyl-CoA dioxygenase family protein [Streptomyces sp. NPDC127051]|uniref:phytanoyl-CoA dioxygenase family protein n=1 Tax=Streptomyces sp. NPDC127051 TaxID=3347119 RepID=UPI0036516471
MHELRGYVSSHYLGLLSVPRFIPHRIRHFRQLHRARPAADIAVNVSALQRDGLAVIENFLNRDQIDELRRNIPEVDAFESSPEGAGSLFFPDAHRIPGLKTFFGDPRLRSIAQSYVSREAIPLRQTIGLKVAKGDIGSSEMNYHMDTWKMRLKAFLFLHDVTATEAPLCYLKGSHKGAWRLWTEARINRYYEVDEKGYAASKERYHLSAFWPHEVRQLITDYDYEEVLCTGSAGTVVLFDGRGLHRATPLVGERRLILTSYWVHPGEHT